MTGGCGFIGANFILFWTKHHSEDSIVNLDMLTYAGNLENLQSLSDNTNYRFVKGDICDPKIVSEAMQGADIIVHFAAESHVDRSILSPAPFVNTNVIGTYVLLEAALKNKIKRFHHISTDEVFGSLELNSLDKFSERTHYNPRSPYSATKAGSDHLVRAYYHTYGLPVTISNCSNNFGPYQFPEKLVPLAITNILEGKKVPVYGDGLHVRDWLYVGDHIRAVERILEKGKIGETYCIGGLTEDINNLAVVKKILAIMDAGESSIEFINERQGHDRRYAMDWTKTKNDLSWQPLHDFDSWLIKTVEWYKDNKPWWRRIKSGEYQSYYKQLYGGDSK